MSCGAHASDFESRYYAAALSGDLSWVTDAKPETRSGLSLKIRFEEYILLGADDYSLGELADPLVSAIVRRFHDYWRQALLAPQDISDAEHRLLTDIAQLVSLAGLTAYPGDIDSALTHVLNQRGFSYSGGRSTPLIDFVLWRDSRTVEYDVELTDGHQSVVVHFLDDLVVRGWLYFATFGHAGTGGWADRDALYCIAAEYDVESEFFRNSYLRHEARHIADYSRFPSTKAVDLEYRGKLTELAFSTDALRLLGRFAQHGNGESIAPHPRASWQVVRDMVRTVRASCTDDAMRCLESSSNQALQTAARKLLADHIP